MKFLINRLDFLRPIARVQGIVEKRTTMPVLSNLLMDVQGDRVEITATDLEVSIRDKAPAVSVEEQGSITVNARKLYEIVRAFPDDELSVSCTEDSKVTIKGAKSRFNVMGLPSASFPEIPSLDGENLNTLKADTLKEMIDRTSFAVATDETRYNINGFLLEKEGGKVKMVATDGHRLAVMEKEYELDLGEAERALLPRKGVMELRKLLEEDGEQEFSIGVSGKSLLVRKEDVSMNFRLLEGEFPDYRRVIPEGNDIAVSADKAELADSLKRVSILSEDRIKGVRFNFSDSRLVLTASSKEIGDATVEMDVERTSGSDEAMEIAFNAVYILDLLDSLQEEKVVFYLKDQLSPGIMRPEGSDDYTYVIMPMRL
jgi:DNA polymerase-3 subunit beta